MSRPSFLFVLSTAVAAGLFAACSSDTAPSTTSELDGPSVAIGNGTAAAYVVEGASGPTSIGIKLSRSALDGLPASDSMWTLPLPSGVVAPPWDHLVINWNAQGHPPAPYMIPHFDFHFYMISSQTQAAIQPGPDTVTVPAANVPPNYISGVEAVPDMGVHWVDTTSAEFQGHTFDRTFVYGFYHGKMIFVEPMITRDFLLSQPNASATIKQPQAYQTAGEYPQTYSVRYDAASQTIRISLDSLAQR